MRLRRIVKVVAIATALTFAMNGTAVALITPVQIVAAKAAQFRPSGSGTWYTWDSNSVAHPNHGNVYAQPVLGGAIVKVNASRTEGFAGGFDPGTNTLIYQQISAGQSNIYLYDLDTRQRTALPGVNTPRWEYQPRISSTHVLFARDVRVGGLWYTTVFLQDRSTLALTKLGKTKDRAVAYYSGSVGDAYASYTLANNFGDGDQNVFVYDIGAGTRHKVPLPDRSAQYSPAVDETTGTLYFMRSGPACGANVRLLTVPVTDLSAAPNQLAQLPKGIDAGFEASLAPSPLTVSGIDYLFARYVCRNGAVDIYAFPDVNA